jgi:hypothetical protein
MICDTHAASSLTAEQVALNSSLWESTAELAALLSVRRRFSIIAADDPPPLHLQALGGR